MKAFQEITEWDCDFAVPNHVYFLNDSRDKMYGFVNSQTGLVEVVKKPYRFHTRGRKFKEVKNTWKFSVDEAEAKPAGRTWQVAGSKGSEYTVSLELGTWSCTCSGFKFRNRCRHVEEISSTVSDPA
jgi:hypothetical protein